MFIIYLVHPNSSCRNSEKLGTHSNLEDAENLANQMAFKYSTDYRIMVVEVKLSLMGIR